MPLSAYKVGSLHSGALIGDVSVPALTRCNLHRRAEELNAARGEPLGLDRRHNKYWRFWLEDHPEGDAGAGRLYIESAADGGFRVLTHQDDLQELLDALERRGAREERLFAELLRQQDSLTRGMPSQPFRSAALKGWHAWALPAPLHPLQALTARLKCTGCQMRQWSGQNSS